MEAAKRPPQPFRIAGTGIAPLLCLVAVFLPVRAVCWAVSWGALGPALGTVWIGIGGTPTGTGTGWAVELTALAVLVGGPPLVLIAFRGRPTARARAVRALAWIHLVDCAVYWLSVVVVAVHAGPAAAIVISLIAMGAQAPMVGLAVFILRDTEAYSGLHPFTRRGERPSSEAW